MRFKRSQCCPSWWSVVLHTKQRGGTQRRWGLGGGGVRGAGPPALKAHEGQIHTCKNGFNSELRPPPRFTQIPSEKFFRSATKRMQWYKSVIPYKYSIYTCLYCSLCILIHRGIFCQEAAGGEGGSGGLLNAAGPWKHRFASRSIPVVLCHAV